MNKDKEYAEYINDLIERKFEFLEGEIKEGIAALLDIYAETKFITCLKLMKEEFIESK